MSTAISSTAVTAPKKLRPARRQVKKGEIQAPVQEQTGRELSMVKSGGDREDSFHTQTKSLTRCILARDAGYTRADALGTKYCCLFFARGCCSLGSDCTFLHRLPSSSHILPDLSMDCFGREKHAAYRDDMGGVGSMMRVNRTLYIGRVKEEGSKKDTEEVVRRHFGEWGDIYRLNVLPGRGVAFVTYQTEINAQFAREAMSHQSLDSDETLNVRWATEDPNPGVIKREKRRVENEGRAAIQGKVDPTQAEAEIVLQALERGQEDELYALDEEDARDEKRPRLIKKSETNQPSSQPDDQIPDGGLLDRDALEGMKYFLEIKRRRETEEASKTETASQPVAGGLGLLGGYGSEDDSD
ncbi:nuclear mrna via spliceosome-related [Phaffia rhodozyma]|uniref:Nuclear mrna via spliceosome-related n=1 Tax=Phaffia rhodozyma TaxID=264483 RepID=A0A0F7SJQ4_PHARH|nr:nuclear mrna via spliceosome-related [Phaffia rhodozyma]